jgi:hypothetical protein
VVGILSGREDCKTILKLNPRAVLLLDLSGADQAETLYDLLVRVTNLTLLT